MQPLLQTNNLEIQSKIRWFPSLNVRYQVLDADTNETVGEIIQHPAWSTPFLWVLGWLLNLGLIAGGGYYLLQGQGGQKWFGTVLLALGLVFIFLFKFHSFLSSRASSTVELRGANNQTEVVATKGWALWKPTYTVEKGDGSTRLGQARQSWVWGDCRYTLWDSQGEVWGSIRRRPFGFQYRVFKGSEQIAQFRRMFVDARKLITGIRSYILQFQGSDLNTDERAFVLGTMAFVDVLVRQKKLREKSEQQPAPPPKKK